MRRIGDSGTTPRHNKLRALGVKLWAVGLVEGEQLVADQIVARLEVCGDLARPLKGLSRPKMSESHHQEPYRMGRLLTLTTIAVAQLVPEIGGAIMPIWSILNHCFDLPSHDEKDAPQSYIHTMTGPCSCVH